MSAFKLNLADLAFVLKQIKIAEANSTAHAGDDAKPLTEIYRDLNGNTLDALGNPITAATPGATLAIPDPKTPFGLRTVDGTYNNLVPGRENWGASGQPMPRLLDPSYVNDTDGDSIDFDGPAPGSADPVVNGNYGESGTIVDADPRTISNLIVDMTMNNPAAILAALTFAGSEDPQADLQSLLALRVTPVEAAAALAGAQTDLNDANDALNDAVLAYNSNPGPATIDGIQDAAQAVTAAEAAVAQAQALVDDPDAALRAAAEELGLEFSENGSLVIPNVAPDEGLSAPFNAWMTFFGQFFDHGLDLISKGDNGTIYVPLQADDPLVLGANGVADAGVPGVTPGNDDLPFHLRFMALTRATTVDGADGEPTQRNVTTPFVDQNQTYTSHASHQVFLREYVLVGGQPLATGKLLGGEDGGLATWADVKAQAEEMLGIVLSDADVHFVPLLRTDAYGEFIRDANGLPQVVVGLGVDGIPNTDDDVVAARPDGDGLLVLADIPGGFVKTNNAFLDDIAHNAAPTGVYDHDGSPATAMIPIAADTDTDTGNEIATDSRGNKVAYDDELLDRHFITGDGRGNENIGLTAVHHIFHSEHNRQVDAQKMTILSSGDLAFINEWLRVPLTQEQFESLPATFPVDADARETLLNSFAWDGERLFQAARFATEMQYQHLVFEEFARKVQPAIDPFVFNSTTDIDPSIFAEFANTVYRFGHSMLTENMPRISADGETLDPDGLGLVEAFLNPVLFDQTGAGTAISHDEAAAAIVRGMTIERGNEIDEFVVDALRNNLLGLPLDLAAINIARGRDTGIPSLNDAREQLYAATGSSFLTPYNSWVDFAANLKNPISVVNFIAAYGQHETILAADTLAEKRDAAMALVFGVATGTATEVPEDRPAFLNSTGAWTAANSGLNDIDLWIGGLAEKKMPFGGMLGSTFNAIFEAQLENLQDGDRFYYLTRTQGQNFLNSLEQNSFAKMIMANTNLAQPGADGIRGTADDVIERHIGVDSFAAYDFVLEVDQTHQAEPDPIGNDPVLEAMGLGKVQRDDPTTPEVDTNYLRFTGGEHIVVGGTNDNDTIITDFGDDGIWGDAGDDRIESGAGVDLVNGGSGNDIITDSGDTGDFLKGDEGDDVIANSNGLDILMGGEGQDVVFVGVDDTEVFGGAGNDFIIGGDGMDFLLGNEGDDWIEAGHGFDTTAGDNSELFFNSAIKGHDVMFAGTDEHDFDAESGDDIMVQGESVMRNEGMFGFDWAIFKGMPVDGYADMRIPIFTTEEEDILRNRFDKVEALSGWENNDTLIGDDRVQGDIAPGDTVATTEGIFFQDELTQAGVDRIEGFRALLGNFIAAAPANATAQQLETLVAFDRGNILLGGAGNDSLRGNGGDDFLDGDAWLNVRIRITEAGEANTAANQIATVDSLKHVFTAAELGDNPDTAGWAGKSLFELLIAREIVPNQLHIVREVITEPQGTDVDIAYYNDIRANYDVVHNADGTVTITHVTVSDVVDPLTERPLVSDGTDRLRNVEIARFLDQDVDIDNEPPVAGNDTIYVSDSTAVVVPWSALLANDVDPDNDTLSITAVTPLTGIGANINVTINAANRTLTFTTPGLGADDTTNNSFSYTVSDGKGGTSTGIVNVRALNANNGGNDNENISAQTYDFSYIATGDGTDTIQGGVGVDHFFGGDDADTLRGGAGNDVLNGGATSDQYDFAATGDGHDTINETTGGGGGSDRIDIETANASTSMDGFNAERIDADGDGAADDLVVRYNGQSITVVNHFGGAAIEDIDFVNGGSANGIALNAGGYRLSDDGTSPQNGVDDGDFGDRDIIAGSNGIETLNGNDGNDILFGNDGGDTLNGGNGDDVLVGGAGADALNGGAGTDTAAYINAAGAVTVNLATNTASGADGTDTLNSIENAVGGAFGDTLTGNGGANVLHGGGGNDTIDGAGGTDVASYAGPIGNFTLDHNGTNIIVTDLTGVEGQDTLSNFETLRFNGVNYTVVVGTNAANINLNGAAGAAGSQAVFGLDGGDSINGGVGDDYLNGGAGVDTLNGGDNNDFLEGGADSDTLNGNAGNDLLAGGSGSDTLNGGTGTDTYRFRQADGVSSDTITDTDAGNIIRLEGFTALSSLNFADSSTAAGGNMVVTYDGGTITYSNLMGSGNIQDMSFGGATYLGYALGAGTWSINSDLTGNAGLNNIVLGSENGETISGSNLADLLFGNGGVDTLNGVAGNDLLVGGAGNDTVNGGDGSDTIVWRASDGRDLINGDTAAANIAGTVDTFHAVGTAGADHFRIYARAEALAAGLTINANTEIVVTLNGTTNAQIIAELNNIEEIVVDGLGGGDTFEQIGDFAPTSLSTSTITINGGTGNDTVDISDLLSAHRIVFRSNGGNDTILGNLRPQDVIELAPGQDLSTYNLVNNPNGTKTLTNGTHSITFSGAVPPQFDNDSTPDEDAIDGVFEYTPGDIAGLKALVNGQQPAAAGDDDVPLGVRNLSGYGNNIENPEWGAADTPFIRITNAHYGDPDAFGNLAINPVFAGLDPRTISNILGTQEAGLPKAGNDANIFFMAMGQYIDHGLDFLGKGGNGSVQIGAPGGGAPGSGNPADLTRGTVAGYEDGVPQHINRTSPYVDQNQAYGSNDLVGQFLREGDGNGGLGAHLLAGAPDPSNPAFKLLPTLRELILEHWDNNTVFHSGSLPGGQVAFRDYFAGLVDGNGVINSAMLPSMISNFMGTQHALLLDTNPFINVLDHYVAGDGRANENFALTSIHTIWARNHNHHVEGLEAAGFQGTAEELFQAAKMINEAEYQRVVFDEYVETLLGGLRSDGTHGFEEYNPDVNTGISHEFAAAVFRFGHSLVGQTMTVLDANGNPQQVALFDAFLNPSNDPSVFPVDPSAFYTPQPGYAQHGVNAIIGGTIQQPAENVDFNIVDAIRNDLVRISADLFAFNVARGWDVGLGTLNQVRKDLAASTDPYVQEAVGFAGGNLTAYTSWEDFQARNGLSDAVINQFRQAYPDLTLAAADIAKFKQINPDIDVAIQANGTGIVKGIDRLDLWVGGLAEQHINDGIVGQTFWVVLHEQFERLQDGDRFYYISRFDNFDFYENFIDGQEFADIVARNTGMTDLPEHLFEAELPDDEDEDTDEDEDNDNDDDEDTDDDEDNEGEDDDEDDEDSDDEEDDDESDDEDDDEDDDSSSDDDEGDDSSSDDDDDDVVVVPGVTRGGTPQADVLAGTAGDDTLVGLAGDDTLVGGAGNDVMRGDAGNDLLSGEGGRDILLGGEGDDDILGGDGADMLYGDQGSDRLMAGEGDDLVTGGAGSDTAFGGAGDDVFVAEANDGDDTYYGDEMGGGTGSDTLNMAAITANITADLGTGFMGRGSASSSQSGNDTLWNVENIVTGSGNDVITASSAVNVMDGGGGNDTYRFLSTTDANGDTIMSFQPGDKIDLSAIDALAGPDNQSFTLVTGSTFTGAGQVIVTHETRADGDYTVVQGNTQGDNAPEFKVSIKGNHQLTNSDFNL